MSRTSPRAFQRLIVIVLTLVCGGCATWRGAAEKSAGRPFSVGLVGSVPLGR